MSLVPATSLSFDEHVAQALALVAADPEFPPASRRAPACRRLVLLPPPGTRPSHSGQERR